MSAPRSVLLLTANTWQGMEPRDVPFQQGVFYRDFSWLYRACLNFHIGLFRRLTDLPSFEHGYGVVYHGLDWYERPLEKAHYRYYVVDNNPTEFDNMVRRLIEVHDSGDENKLLDDDVLLPLRLRGRWLGLLQDIWIFPVGSRIIMGAGLLTFGNFMTG